MFALFATSANAYSTTGTITDHYKIVISQTPYSVEVCRDVNVNGDKTGDALKGAIIGGIIGNNVGNIENGGAAGAIIGGIRTQCTVETRYNEMSSEVYSHSTITFYDDDGRSHTLRYIK